MTYGGASEEEVINALVGNSVVDATEDTLTLSNGTQLKFQREANDCCSYLELERLATTPSIITSASFVDEYEEDEGVGPYKSRIHVLTEAGDINVAEAEGDASNGYYLRGFALDVEIIPSAIQPATDDEVADAIRRITERTI